MTRHGTVLPIPDVLRPFLTAMVSAWAGGEFSAMPYPRSAWLSQAEGLLREFIPGHSSRDYNLTARSLAPFPLAEHDWL